RTLACRPRTAGVAQEGEKTFRRPGGARYLDRFRALFLAATPFLAAAAPFFLAAAPFFLAAAPFFLAAAPFFLAAAPFFVAAAPVFVGAAPTPASSCRTSFLGACAR